MGLILSWKLSWVGILGVDSYSPVVHLRPTKKPSPEASRRRSHRQSHPPRRKKEEQKQIREAPVLLSGEASASSPLLLEPSALPCSPPPPRPLAVPRWPLLLAAAASPFLLHGAAAASGSRRPLVAAAATGRRAASSLRVAALKYDPSKVTALRVARVRVPGVWGGRVLTSVLMCYLVVVLLLSRWRRSPTGCSSASNRFLRYLVLHCLAMPFNLLCILIC